MYNSMSGNSIVDNMIYEMIFGSRVSFDSLLWQGGYDASLNVPPSPVSAGYFYVITAPGTFGGITYETGSFAWFSGTDWFKTPALTTGVTAINSKTGNVSFSTDDLIVGTMKLLTPDQLSRVANLPLNTVLELSRRFNLDSNTSDNITQGIVNLFLLQSERNKIANVPADTITELSKKFDKTVDTIDEIQNGVDYVKTENNFTDSLKTKLEGLEGNFKGSFNNEAEIIAAYPTASRGDWAINYGTNTIWLWDVSTLAWTDTEKGSIGDMQKIVYDPTGKNTDAFDMDNMDDGSSKVGMTTAERIKLSNIGAGDNLLVTALEKNSISTIEDKVDKTDLISNIYLKSVDSNTVDVERDGGTDTLSYDVRYQDTDTASITSDVNGIAVDVIENKTIQKVTVSKASSDVGSRKQINLVEGSNISMAISDNAAEDRIDVVINSIAIAGTVSVSEGDTEIVSSASDISFDETQFNVAQDGLDPNKARIEFVGSVSDELVGVTENDTAPNFLSRKVVSGNNIQIELLDSGADESLSISVPVALNVAEAELMSGDTRSYLYVKELKTIYEYLSSVETVDNMYALNTGDGGDTRWIGVSGTYIYNSLNVKNNVIIDGDLTVKGTKTIINTEEVDVKDKDIVIGNVEIPTDITADGGGVILKGDTDKTLKWMSSTASWSSSENMNLDAGRKYMIGAVQIGSLDVLNNSDVTGATIDDALNTINTNVAYVNVANIFTQPQSIEGIDSGKWSVTDSTSSFNIFEAGNNSDDGGYVTLRDAGGVANVDFRGDKTNYILQNLAVGKPTANYKLDVNGDINVGVGDTYRIGGVDIIPQLFNKTTDDMDSIPDGADYVKTENNFSDSDKAKVDSIQEAILDTFGVETKVLQSIPYSTINGAIINYNISNGIDLRTGCLYVVTDGTTVNVTDNSVDLGDSSAVDFDGEINGSNLEISVTSTAGSWNIKYTIIKL
jgi:hypothetical protein